MLQKGFTLIEVMLVCLVAALLLGYGVPAFQFTLEQRRADGAARAIFRGFQYARQEAIVRQRTLTVCGSNDGQNCSQQWGKSLLIFHDRDDDAQSDPGELLRQESLDLQGRPITATFGLGNNRTSIYPDGRVSWQGSMVYCLRGETEARRVTWNRSGRPYFGQDRDGDGIVEETNGDPIDC